MLSLIYLVIVFVCCNPTILGEFVNAAERNHDINYVDAVTIPDNKLPLSLQDDFGIQKSTDENQIILENDLSNSEFSGSGIYFAVLDTNNYYYYEYYYYDEQDNYYDDCYDQNYYNKYYYDYNSFDTGYEQYQCEFCDQYDNNLCDNYSQVNTQVQLNVGGEYGVEVASKIQSGDEIISEYK